MLRSFWEAEFQFHFESRVYLSRFLENKYPFYRGCEIFEEKISSHEVIPGILGGFKLNLRVRIIYTACALLSFNSMVVLYLTIAFSDFLKHIIYNPF